MNKTPTKEDIEEFKNQMNEQENMALEIAYKILETSFSIEKSIAFKKWYNKWEDRILINKGSKEKSIALMRKHNPIVIPRNHKVEEALEDANNNDFELINKLLVILDKPYNNQDNIMDYKSPSNDNNYQTFCGT